MKGVIIVPVYNEETVFWDWFPRLFAVAEQLDTHLIVVDDGSFEPLELPQAFENAERLHLLRHVVNVGVGAAIQTGFKKAQDMGVDYLLTIDADGQHSPEDLLLLREGLERSVLVNGSRFLGRQEVPMSRRVANIFANLLLWVAGGGWWTDSQSGMKGLRSEGFFLLRGLPNGYGWCSEFLRKASEEGVGSSEVKISILYNLYTMSKGQCFGRGLDMCFSFFFLPFRRFSKKALSQE